ncbi:MAG: hypothetical protein KBT05_06515 [Bacteroidales bacterium]|nr:hypothetical protein [Candidatus Cryptobacteroides caccocaballi]
MLSVLLAFLTTLFLLISTLLIALAFILHFSFISKEAKWQLTPEDAKWFLENEKRDDDGGVTPQMWNKDRYAYREWRRCHFTATREFPKTDLPFTEWVETLSPGRRQHYRKYGHSLMGAHPSGSWRDVKSYRPYFDKKKRRRR